MLLLDSEVSQILSQINVADTIWDLSVSGDGLTVAVGTNRPGPLIVKRAIGGFQAPLELPAIPDANTDQSPSIHAVQFAEGGQQLWAGTSSRIIGAWDLGNLQLVPDQTAHRPQSSILGDNFDSFPHRLQRVYAALEPNPLLTAGLWPRV